jgi:nitroreductase
MSQYPFIPYRMKLVPEDEMVDRGPDLYRQMSSRRSVRHFSSKPVSRASIELAIRIAATAPSGANRQPRSFVAVSDPGVKRKIREAAEAEERVGVKPEDRGRAARPVDDPLRVPEDREDVVPLDVFQSCGRLDDKPRSSLAEHVRIDFQCEARREDDCALQDVLQVADVARPGIRLEPADRGGIDAVKPPGVPRRELVEKVLRQERDVLRPITERRDLDREDTQPVVQVLTERLFADGLLHVTVGGGDDTDVDLPRARADDPIELVLPQDAEELGLAVGGELADLAKEDRPPVGQLEPARVPGDRPGERPLLVAEQLTRDQPRRQGRAVGPSGTDVE